MSVFAPPHPRPPRAPPTPLCAMTSDDGVQKPAALQRRGLNRPNNVRLQSFPSELACVWRAAGTPTVFPRCSSQVFHRGTRASGELRRTQVRSCGCFGLFKSNHGQFEMLNVLSHKSQMNGGSSHATLLTPSQIRLRDTSSFPVEFPELSLCNMSSELTRS